MTAVKVAIWGEAVKKHSCAVRNAAIAHLGPEYWEYDVYLLEHHTILDARIRAAYAYADAMIDIAVQEGLGR